MDGAAVMKRVGRSLKVNQLCLSHGIQLSVIKVLYTRSISDHISVENQEVAVTEFEHRQQEKILSFLRIHQLLIRQFNMKI